MVESPYRSGWRRPASPNKDDRVPLHKLSTTTAWVIVDLEGAGRSVGMARLAPKVLQSGGVMPARSATYTAAAFGRQWGGATAGINATPEDRDEVLAAFRAEVAPLVEAGLSLQAGPGLEPTDLDGLSHPLPDPSLAARGAVAAAAAVLERDLGAARLAVAGGDEWTGAVGAALQDGTPATADLGGPVDADVLFVGGAPGIVDHEVAPHLNVGAVVPLSPIPVTARALAILTRAGSVVVPDFVSAAAPWLVSVDGLDPDGAVAKLADLAGAVAAGPGTWMAAAERAEAFLSTWRAELPFGRPLA